jgi:hypothetical protein
VVPAILNTTRRLWFTLLDAKDPSRKFSFRMSVDDQDMFVVEDCQPFIQPDTLAQLLQQVNDTDRGQEDFSKLILSMRKKQQQENVMFWERVLYIFVSQQICNSCAYCCIIGKAFAATI